MIILGRREQSGTEIEEGEEEDRMGKEESGSRTIIFRSKKLLRREIVSADYFLLDEK